MMRLSVGLGKHLYSVYFIITPLYVTCNLTSESVYSLVMTMMITMIILRVSLLKSFATYLNCDNDTENNHLIESSTSMHDL